RNDLSRQELVDALAQRVSVRYVGARQIGSYRAQAQASRDRHGLEQGAQRGCEHERSSVLAVVEAAVADRVAREPERSGGIGPGERERAVDPCELPAVDRSLEILARREWRAVERAGVGVAGDAAER